MFVHIWRMKGRKKRGEEYEKFGRQVTLPALKKIDGCLDAHFVKVFEARKPEYLWLVFWRNKEALEAARTNSSWRDQIKRFEAGKFYKTIPLELVCESMGSFGGVSVDKLKKGVAAGKSGKGGKARKSETSGNTEAADRAEIQSEEGSSKAFTPPTAEGE